MNDTIRAWWHGETVATRTAIVLMILLGLGQRIAWLAQPMRYDEAVTYLYFVGRPWYIAISSYQFPNNHLLYTVMAKVMSSLTHGAPWALRLPAFLAGVAIIPLTYAVGRALFTPTSALIGTALVSGSTTLTLYATNARGYSLVVAAYLTLLLLGARVRAGRASPRLWIAFALVSAAGLATIPIMLYPMGAATVWLGLVLVVERGPKARPDLIALCGALGAGTALAALTYIPIIHANGVAALTANKFVLPSPWPQFFGELFPSLGHALAGWSQPFPLVVLPLLMGALVVGVARSTRISHEGVSVMIAALMWSAVVLLGNHRAPFPRTWLWLLPIACLLVGVSIELMGHRVIAVVRPIVVPAFALGLLAFAMAWGGLTDAVGDSLDTGLFRGAEQVAQALRGTLQSGDRVLAPIPSNAPLQFYLLRNGADTAALSTPPALTRRSILVLNRAYGQTLDWAVAAGMIDTAQFGPIAPAMHTVDADVYVAERKVHAP